MERKQIITMLFLMLLSLFMFRCSNPTEVSGGSEVGNARVIAGTFIYEGGAAAANVTVNLRPKDYLPQPGFAKALVTEASVITDSNGYFAMDSVDSGTYVIQALDDSARGVFIDPIPVPYTYDTLDLAEDTLKATGSITGTILISGTPGSPRINVLIYGRDNISVPDSTGSFTIDNIAEGSYDLHIITENNVYPTKDSADIHVISGASTDLDTLSLFYLSITSPNGGEIWYSSQTYSITWETNLPGQVKLYYSTLNQYYWTLIDSCEGSLGTYSWQPSGINQDTQLARIRILSETFQLEDISDTTFSIFLN
jgi:hypothetical protein